MVSREVIQGINSVDALQSQLKQAGVPVDQFGTGKAKTLDHLFSEIASGETALVQDKEGLLRQVAFVALDVRYNDKGQKLMLVEDRQVFTDGRERKRDLGWSVSEKLTPKEKPAAAAKRTLEEELNVSGKVKIKKGKTEESKKTSPSYPGLTSRYIIHHFGVQLNEGQYNPDGYTEEQPDKTTYWVWKEA